jgi:mono/diheme cytochrome c family protein
MKSMPDGSRVLRCGMAGRQLLLARAPRGVVLAAVLALGCAHGVDGAREAAVDAPRPPPSLEPAALREHVRVLAKTHCGQCHQASRPTAKPAALAIYNLDADDWSDTLSAARLEGGFTRRLNGRLDTTDRRLLREFVVQEVARRGR